MKYTVDNVKETIKEIKQIKADLGGTKLLKPLKYIFNKVNYDNLNLCKNLFILINGEIFDREKS